MDSNNPDLDPRTGARRDAPKEKEGAYFVSYSVECDWDAAIVNFFKNLFKRKDEK